MKDSSSLGSASWTNGQEYEGEHAHRIDQFLSSIDEQALLSYVSLLRENQACTISPQFSVGNFHLVRKIQFDDGIEWIVRLRMPPIVEAEQTVSLSQKEVLLAMRSELATMELVRRNTDIPIPKIHACELEDDNAIGCPFSIMDYVHANTAEEMSRTYDSEQTGIPVQFEEKFWRQVAKIMVQLASIRMMKIGSIMQDSSGGFIVGPLIETGTGPYRSAAEFYADYPLALSKSLGERPVYCQNELVQAFCSLAASFHHPTEQGNDSITGFGLANYDLNPNNILVDREFNVLAVIDWDSVISVPDAALYRLPFLMGISCAIPGLVDTHPAVVKREQLGRQFAEVVEAVGREEVYEHKSSSYLLTKSGFFSKEAVAFRSMVYVKNKQDWVNKAWLQGLKWLSEHTELQVVQFYLQN